MRCPHCKKPLTENDIGFCQSGYMHYRVLIDKKGVGYEVDEFEIAKGIKYEIDEFEDDGNDNTYYCRLCGEDLTNNEDELLKMLAQKKVVL